MLREPCSGPRRMSMPPPGGSTRITSAPSAASSTLPIGPAMNAPSSTIRSPARMGVRRNVAVTRPGSSRLAAGAIPGSSFHAQRLPAINHRAREPPRSPVDHLVAEHHGADLVHGDRRAIRLEDRRCLIELLLRGSEDIVEDSDLRGVQRPLAIESETARPQGRGAKSVEVADLRVRPVDRLQRVGPRRDRDPGQKEVSEVDIVRGVDPADRELRRVQRRGQVAGTEDQRLGARGRRRDRPDMLNPARGLDQQLEPDPGAEAELLLELLDEPRHEVDVVDALDLRYDESVDGRTRALDDRDDVFVTPRRLAPVDADRAKLAGVLARSQRVYDQVPSGRLRTRRDRVLEVEHDLVGGRLLGAGVKSQLRAGHGEARPSDPVRRAWQGHPSKYL